ncbi:Rsd/AlgQ family anti-sigma factor [Catenovulum maritimum]|uniref:Anti-RNA polymerase sigma 70 factor n=1 Tax=Catenovulum maritimum TaxID=1513271 RepID=A0A0J8JKR3_9ALTE|nr:Rsd/AlgQ family anti-sigma factor [Catenovulum maritimum]KMT65081.1 anti-RNA polymerase sigma 70 factor [Catenovulum maritimum]
MLTDLKQTQQKYGGANTIIDNWLAERQDLLVKYCHLIQQGSALPQAEEVVEFCQVLVDYLSAGHFEIFDDIVSKCEKNGGESKALAHDLLPKITSSTDLALNFNDTYTSVVDDSVWKSFDEDLAKLGQALEDRFEYEDQLIHNLYTKHTETA